MHQGKRFLMRWLLNTASSVILASSSEATCDRVCVSLDEGGPGAAHHGRSAPRSSAPRKQSDGLVM